jgi:hypothetical protein
VSAPPRETFGRIAANLAIVMHGQELPYRYRFDPAGLGLAERRRLQTDAEPWLAEHPPAPASARAAEP